MLARLRRFYFSKRASHKSKWHRLALTALQQSLLFLTCHQGWITLTHLDMIYVIIFILQYYSNSSIYLFDTVLSVQ